MEWENIDTQTQKNIQATMAGWSIKNLVEDDRLRRTAQSEWEKKNKDQ